MPVHVKISSIMEIEKGETYIDLDSRADKSVLGSNVLKVEIPYRERTAIVSFADPSVGTVNTPIISGAFLYTHYNGNEYILVVHQAIFLENMKHSLLCPMQVRENDIILNRIQVMAVILRPLFGVLFLRGHISLIPTHSYFHIDNRIDLKLKYIDESIMISVDLPSLEHTHPHDEKVRLPKPPLWNSGGS
jgi:hypothetical protein